MADDQPIETGYSYTTQNNIETADFNLEALQEVMKEFRKKFDDDISRALFSSPSNPLLRFDPPKIEYEPAERPFTYNWRHSFGMPVHESHFIPRGEAAIVAGHGVLIGTGPTHEQLDKLGMDLGHVWYALPKWAIFAILAMALMLLVLLVA